MMKTKLNLFRATLVVFIVLYVFSLFFYVLATYTGGHAVPKEMFRVSFFGNSIKTGFYVYLALSTIVDAILIYALINLLKITDGFKAECFFTSKIISLLRVTGKCLVVVATVGFLLSVFYHYSFSQHFVERMLLPFFYHFMVLVIGLGILLIEEIQKRALYIKTENDLTI